MKPRFFRLLARTALWITLGVCTGPGLFEASEKKPSNAETRLWVGTDRGLYQLSQGALRRLDGETTGARVEAIAADPLRGYLWTRAAHGPEPLRPGRPEEPTSSGARGPGPGATPGPPPAGRIPVAQPRLSATEFHRRWRARTLLPGAGAHPFPPPGGRAESPESRFREGDSDLRRRHRPGGRTGRGSRLHPARQPVRSPPGRRWKLLGSGGT